VQAFAVGGIETPPNRPGRKTAAAFKLLLTSPAARWLGWHCCVTNIAATIMIAAMFLTQ
jgi:hypothetical protein